MLILIFRWLLLHQVTNSSVSRCVWVPGHTLVWTRSIFSARDTPAWRECRLASFLLVSFCRTTLHDLSVITLCLVPVVEKQVWWMGTKIRQRELTEPVTSWRNNIHIVAVFRRLTVKYISYREWIQILASVKKKPSVRRDLGKYHYFVFESLTTRQQGHLLQTSVPLPPQCFRMRKDFHSLFLLLCSQWKWTSDHLRSRLQGQSAILQILVPGKGQNRGTCRKFVPSFHIIMCQIFSISACLY